MLSLWTVAIIVISVKHFINKRVQSKVPPAVD